MKRETWERLQEAGQYQKKALSCLLPEECRPHIEVIHEEISQIGKLLLQDVVKSYAKKESDRGENEHNKESADIKHKQGKRKIEID